MKKTNIQIRGGYSFVNGFVLFSRNYKLIAKRKFNGQIEIRALNYKDYLLTRIGVFVEKIPFVGELLSLAFFCPLIFCLLALSQLGTLFFMYLLNTWVDVNPFFLLFVYGILEIFTIFVLYIVFLIVIFTCPFVLRYHSIEHKTINCLNEGVDLTHSNIKKISSFNPYCGSLLLLLSLPILLILAYYIPITPMLNVLIAFSAAIFIRNLAVKYEIASVLIVAYLVQKLACWNPSDEQFEVGIAAGKKLIELEANVSVR